MLDGASIGALLGENRTPRRDDAEKRRQQHNSPLFPCFIYIDETQ
jgi:hypothetical protein